MDNTYFINAGKTEVLDRRSEQDKKEKTFLVTAVDKYLSGWGKASEGKSKCAWACTEKQALQVYKWVNKRNDITYVNIH